MHTAIHKPFTFLFLAITCACVLLYPHHSFAIQVNPAHIPDDIVNRFKDVLGGANGFQNKMESFAEHIFYSLIPICLVIRFFPMALKQSTMEEFVQEIFKFSLTMGFFMFLIRNGVSIGMSIIHTFEQMAGIITLGSSSRALQPSSVLEIGLKFYETIADGLKSFHSWQVFESLSLWGMGLAFLILCALVSITVMMAMIKAWMMVYGGAVLLSLGVAVWTQEMIINYFKSAISYGVRIFTLFVVVDACVGVLRTYVDGQHEFTIHTSVEVLLLALVMYMMSNKLPEVISGMVGASFTSHSNFGNMAQTVKGVAETAAKVSKAATPQGAAVQAAEMLAKSAGNEGGSASGIDGAKVKPNTSSSSESSTGQQPAVTALQPPAPPPPFKK
ncbi:P-type conjugative transfer protein TrbL [Acetobacteraceae bacterium]|nr:P-type conjugative transfer protein TrbL [Acetobacteraceae bacterium]